MSHVDPFKLLDIPALPVSLPPFSTTPLPPLSRRGNWITLKMKKLIKPKSRERMRSLTLTPTRSDSSEGFLSVPLDSQDSSSVGSGSNSLDDTLVNKRSNSECLTSSTPCNHSAARQRPVRLEDRTGSRFCV